MDAYFTEERIKHLITDHDWEMVSAGLGRYRLRQKDNHGMITVSFRATDEVTKEFCRDFLGE